MYLRSSERPIESDSPTLDWTIALAGSDGVKLADYITGRFGHRIPKPYCRFAGRRSMLEHTLDRLNRLTPTWRTMTVIGNDHVDLATPQLETRSDHVFQEPAQRGTAVAIYVALALIKRWTPNAVITITPSDHYIAPAQAYIDQLRVARGIVAQMRDKVLLIGARTTESCGGLGFLSLREPLVDIPEVRRVGGFTGTAGDATLANTLVTCGTASALWELGRAAQPEMIELLDFLAPLLGMPDEFDATDHIYRSLPPLDFVRDVLDHQPQRLMAMALENIEWSDWSQPSRIEAVLSSRIWDDDDDEATFVGQISQISAS